MPSNSTRTPISEEDDSILKRSFRDLRSRNADVRLVAARSIRQFLEQELRERSGDGFSKVMNNLQIRIAEYGASLDMYEKLGCILLIDELVVLAVENESMVIRFMNQLSIIIKEQTKSSGEMDVLGAATRALGHLARSGAPGLTYDLLEHEISTALNWMRIPENQLPISSTTVGAGMSKHASMMIITELAKNAPALFSAHVKVFFVHLWGVLTDQKIQVRVRAALALRSVLRLLVGSGNVQTASASASAAAAGNSNSSNNAINFGSPTNAGSPASSQQSPLPRQQSLQTLIDQQRKRPHDIVYAKAKSVFPPPGGDWSNKKKKVTGSVSTAATSPMTSATTTSSTTPDKDPFHPSHRAAHMRMHNEDAASAGYSTSSPTSGGGTALLLVNHYDFTNIPLIHAALLTLYELLDPVYAAHSNMDSFFLEMLQDCVWREEIRNHKDGLILHHVIAILPRLAGLCPNDMMAVYLAKVVQYLLDLVCSVQELNTAKANSDRSAAFRALGQLSSVPRVGKWFTPHVVPILKNLHLAISITPKKPAVCEEALECLEILVRCQDPYGLSSEAKDEVRGMVGALFAGGLSESLVQTLITLGNAVPSLLPTFRQRLLQEITMVLGQATGQGQSPQQQSSQPQQSLDLASKRRPLFWSNTVMRDKIVATNKALEQRLGLYASSADPYLVASLQGMMDGAPQHPSATAVAEATSLNLKNAFSIKKPLAKDTSSSASSASGAAATGSGPNTSSGISLHSEMEIYEQRLALKTLGTFDFRGVALLPLVMAAVVQFLESPNVGVRYEAVIACCRLLSSSSHNNDRAVAAAEAGGGGKAAGNGGAGGGKAQNSMEDYRNASDYVVERLVVMAMSDTDPDIRCRVVEELDSRHFRELMLENPENLRSLFVLVNDNHFGVRAAAVVAIGHAAELAPSYVVPTMRTVLVRLLTELDFGGDLKHREESAALLGLLVQSLDPPLSRPHVDPMLKGLLPKLKDSNPAAAAAMMAALGEVATVARDSLLPHVGEILSVVIETLEERSTHHGNLEKEVALHTLSKVAKSTIMSIWPYFIRKKLLPLILQVLMSASSPESVRRQAMIALGTLGALDPWLHKKIQASNQGEEEDFSLFSFEERFSWWARGDVQL
ncbi:hypothetical protein BASA81_015438 [Batrachochytrium salamandrivorans]|nr:hypothetical protein BASA81_015438 [Batrachochytrium salamandrivorans]